MAAAIISLIIAGMIPVLPLDTQAQVSLGRTRSIAETQHEIVMLLIKKKEFGKAVTEADKIFNMKWPADQEPLLLSELRLLSDELRRQGQVQLSLQLIDRNSRHFKSTASKIAILKEKGYLHKCIGENDKAYEYFTQAKRLEDDDDD